MQIFVWPFNFPAFKITFLLGPVGLNKPKKMRKGLLTRCFPVCCFQHDFPSSLLAFFAWFPFLFFPVWVKSEDHANISVYFSIQAKTVNTLRPSFDETVLEQGIVAFKAWKVFRDLCEQKEILWWIFSASVCCSPLS